jgi:methylase of polypeptide subunit release factors
MYRCLSMRCQASLSRLSSQPFDPIPDRKAAELLGAVLRDAGYDEDAIVELLGDDGPAADTDDVPVHERRLDDSALATIVRLLLLQLPVRLDDLTAAIARAGVDALLATGLATAGGETIVPLARIVPAEGLLMAFDGFARGLDDPVGFVAPFTPTASWLAAVTPRRHAARALDVGTGNGVHALLAAGHADHVIATDVNPRALAFTEINAALNGLKNVETRLGSLFDPVAGQQFDLITCNAPYVVSPESRWQYRDGGLPADELSERVVKLAAASLAPDGYAALLVSWVAESEDEPDERLEGWLEESGSDAWVMELAGSDPLEHTAGWNEHLASDPEAYAAALDEWLAYFDRLGVGWISEGAVLLHRRDGDEYATRIDAVDSDELESAADQVERVFRSHAQLAALDGDETLLEQTVVLSREVRLEQVWKAGSRDPDTTLALDEGTHSDYELDPDVAEVVKILDGSLTLGRAVERVVRAFELDRREAAELRRDSLAETRDLLELGIAELR